MPTFTDAEWFERSEQLQTGALTLEAMAGDETLPINAAARATLRGVATILRSEATRIKRLQRVTA